MTPTLADHFVVLFLLVAIPLLSTRNYRRFQQAVRTGGPGTRGREYWKGISRQWVVTLIFMLYWWWVGRPWNVLGLEVPTDSRSLWGLGVTLLVLGFLYSQWRSVRGLSQAELAELAPRTSSVADLLPHGPAEARTFRVLAFTAGTCEEILYRGFLLAYLAFYFGAWPAVLIGGIAFGIAHAYQGVSGIVKTGVVGLLAGALYVATGSLLWPMLLHTGIDLHGGAVGGLIVQAVDAARATPREA